MKAPPGYETPLGVGRGGKRIFLPWFDNLCRRLPGPSPFISKVIGIFGNMDRMIGKDFEAGLAELKTIAEK
jgi:hypothetical protein